MATQYELKNYKSLNTHNGVAWTATLYKGRFKIAYVEDQGNGGSIMVSWNISHEKGCADLEKWFLENCEGHWTAQFANLPTSSNEELAINLLDEIRANNKIAKTKILFRESGVVEIDERGMVVQVPEYTMNKTTIADTNALGYILNQHPHAQVWHSSVGKFVNIDLLLMKASA